MARAATTNRKELTRWIKNQTDIYNRLTNQMKRP